MLEVQSMSKQRSRIRLPFVFFSIYFLFFADSTCLGVIAFFLFDPLVVSSSDFFVAFLIVFETLGEGLVSFLADARVMLMFCLIIHTSL